VLVLALSRLEGVLKPVDEALKSVVLALKRLDGALKPVVLALKRLDRALKRLAIGLGRGCVGVFRLGGLAVGLV
jgi:hypothetical protein